jgi:hypothetical protein
LESSTDHFPQKKLAAFFFESSIEAIIGLLFLLLIPSDVKNQWILGYSLPRVVLIAIFLAAGFCSLWAFIALIKKSSRIAKIWSWLESKPNLIFLIRFFAVLILFSLLLVITNPSIRFGNWRAQLERLLPLIWYLILLCLQTILLFKFRAKQVDGSSFIQFIKQNRPWIVLFAIILSLLLVLWGIIGLTGVGVKGDWGLWVETGVPILSRQVFWILCVVLVIQILNKIFHNKFQKIKFFNWLSQHQDTWICISIWLFTILIWTLIPQKSNYFFPGPYAPNYEFYPYSDASAWDLAGQNVLIGQGFANGNVSFDHLGLCAFLAMLHALVGQNYSHIVTAQIVLFAAFPVIFYGLGKSIHGRYLGIFLAGLSIIHEVNAFACENILNLSHSKMLMTEFPTGLGLIILSLCLFLWARNHPEKNMGYLLPVGGILAILILLRFNTVGMPVAVIAGIILILWRKWKQVLIASCLVLLSFTMVLSPWMIHSWQATGSPFFFAGKVSNIFNPDFRTPTKVEPTPTPTNLTQSLDPSTELNNQNPQISNPVSDIEQTPGTGEIILNHFVHNFVTSVMILPATPYFYDLNQIIYEVNPFWDRSSSGPWFGEISVLEGIFILFNLIILSLGFSYAWRRWRLAGLIPFGIYAAFNLFLAVARTSGGRYIVPIEWVVLLYYGLGIYQIGISLIHLMGIKLDQTGKAGNQVPMNIRKGLLLMLPFFLFVLTMTIMDQAIQPRYADLSKSEVVEKIASDGLLEGSDLDINELRTFIKSQDAEAYFGRSLYPRYYLSGEGEYSSSKTVYSHFAFPRISFLLIGPFDNKAVLLPLTEMPEYFPQAADVLVVGCKNQTIRKNNIDAFLVIVEGVQGNVIYTRAPHVPLSCPLADPVAIEK